MLVSTGKLHNVRMQDSETRDSASVSPRISGNSPVANGPSQSAAQQHFRRVALWGDPARPVLPCGVSARG